MLNVDLRVPGITGTMDIHTTLCTQYILHITGNYRGITGNYRGITYNFSLLLQDYYKPLLEKNISDPVTGDVVPHNNQSPRTLTAAAPANKPHGIMYTLRHTKRSIHG